MMGESEGGSRGRGVTRAAVSSHHHQAVTEVPGPLRIVATAPDGVVEGVELDRRDGPWIVGIGSYRSSVSPLTIFSEA